MKTIAIIQARMGSTRLPGKVLMEICGKPMLQRVVERVSLAELDGLVVATSFAEEDYQIVQWCQDNRIPVMRGGLEVNDVLGRYWDVATLVGADVIVRVTADCPLIDPGIINEVIHYDHDSLWLATTGTIKEALIEGRLFRNDMACDIVSNVIPRTFPDGLDVEAFTYEALMLAHQNTTIYFPAGLDIKSGLIRGYLSTGDFNAKALNDREHVTSWMRRNLRTGAIVNDEDLSALRWTVDTQEDLDFVRSIYANLKEDFRWRDVLEWQNTH